MHQANICTWNFYKPLMAILDFYVFKVCFVQRMKNSLWCILLFYTVHDCVKIFNSFNLQFLDIIKTTKLTKNMAPMCDIPVDSLDMKVIL
jgi:hypothetical protein